MEKNKLVHHKTEIMKDSPVEGCTFFKTALIIGRKINFEEVQKLYDKLHAVKGSVLWWIGDLVTYAEGNFREKYSQLFDPMDYEVETIRGAWWVASRVPVLNRHEDVAFGIYKLIAKYEPKEQEKILKKVRERHLSVRDVEKMLAGQKEKEKAAENAVPVVAMGCCTDFLNKMQAAIKEMPVKKWEPKALAVLETSFNSMVHETRKLFGWEAPK